MLVLSRKAGERILIGEDVVVTVVRVSQGIVRLGVEAPSNLSVVREEVVIPMPSKPEPVATKNTKTKKATSKKTSAKTTKRK